MDEIDISTVWEMEELATGCAAVHEALALVRAAREETKTDVTAIGRIETLLADVQEILEKQYRRSACGRAPAIAYGPRRVLQASSANDVPADELEERLPTREEASYTVLLARVHPANDTKSLSDLLANYLRGRDT